MFLQASGGMRGRPLRTRSPASTRPTTRTRTATRAIQRYVGKIVEPRLGAKCWSEHETWCEGEDDRGASIMKRRNGRWVSVGGNRGLGAVLPGFDTLRAHERRIVSRIWSTATAADSHPRIDRRVPSPEEGVCAEAYWVRRHCFSSSCQTQLACYGRRR